MQNPKLRDKAEKRYASTTKEFEKISEIVADAKADFAPLEADLKDVHTYLKTDLSKERRLFPVEHDLEDGKPGSYS